MELLWIFLLIFNVCVASGNKPDTRPEDCHRECVVFNIPHILCAPDVSKVSVTPYYECTTVPKFRNLLSKECLTPLYDFPTERCRKECCEPQPCKPPKSQVSYQSTDSYIADPVDPDGSLGSVGNVEPTFTDETWQGNPQDDDNAPPVEEDIPPGTLNQYLIPPKKPPSYLEAPTWPPNPEPPKTSPPCVEPPKWPPPPCPEPPKPPQSCEKPPNWPPPPCSYPPTWPPACCEPPKWPPPCPEPPKESPPCVEQPKWPSPCPEPPNLPPSCQEPPKWPPSCPYPPNRPLPCCEPSNWPPPQCPEPPTWPPSCCEPPNWPPPPCPEPPKPPQKSCKPKECLTPVLQNAPTSCVAYPDIGCGCYVNPRYFCELYKLYNQDDDENVSNDPISYSTGQDKYGQKLGPVETSYTGTNPNNRGTIPAGRTMLLYNTNPKDRVWTSSSRDGEFVPALCFDREYINKYCRSCPPPPPPPPSPPPKPQPQYPPYITQDEQLGNAQPSSPGQVPPQEMGAEQPESELQPEDIPNFDINFVPASSIPDFHNSEIKYEQLNQDQDETPIDNNPADTSKLPDDFDDQRK